MLLTGASARFRSFNRLRNSTCRMSCPLHKVSSRDNDGSGESNIWWSPANSRRRVRLYSRGSQDERSGSETPLGNTISSLKRASDRERYLRMPMLPIER